MLFKTTQSKKYTWYPTPVFDGLLIIKITEEIVTKKRFLFWEWTNKQHKQLFNGLNGDATEFLKANPHIVLDGVTL